MDRAVIAVTSDADRVLAAALGDLGPVLTELRGSVLVVGGLMQRIWLELRPVEGIAPRATADVDLGIDRKSLQLTASSERVGPLLTERVQTACGRGRLPLREGTRARVDDRRLVRGQGGLSRRAADPGEGDRDPGGARLGVRPDQADGHGGVGARRGTGSTVVEVPLPSLDAAFVLKAALVASGVRLRPDRRERDTVDAVMLAAVCASDSAAVHALAEGSGRSEVKRALALLREGLGRADRAAARRVVGYLQRERGVAPEIGAEWVVQVAARLAGMVDAARRQRQREGW